MKEPHPAGALRFLFDEHVHAAAARELRERGIDVAHVVEMGLGGVDDGSVFLTARGQRRILVTRNYQDFAPLVAEAVRQRIPFPGVLFLSTSLPQADVGAHVRALEGWARDAEATGTNPVGGTFGWLG